MTIIIQSLYWKFTIFQLSFMQKFVKYFFKNFLALIAAYHIIVTILGYGIIGWDSQTYISFVRDALWILFVGIVFIAESEKLWGYLKKWKHARIWFVILIVFSILISFWKWVSLSNMMIGIKYWFRYLLIFLTASFVWYTCIRKFTEKEISRI